MTYYWFHYTHLPNFWQCCLLVNQYLLLGNTLCFFTFRLETGNISLLDSIIQILYRNKTVFLQGFHKAHLEPTALEGIKLHKSCFVALNSIPPSHMWEQRSWRDHQSTQIRRQVLWLPAQPGNNSGLMFVLRKFWAKGLYCFHKHLPLYSNVLWSASV